MFKATEVERRIREMNLLTDMQINFSPCRTSDQLFLTDSPPETASQDCMGFGNIEWLNESFICLDSIQLEASPVSA